MTVQPQIEWRELLQRARTWLREDGRRALTASAIGFGVGWLLSLLIIAMDSTPGKSVGTFSGNFVDGALFFGIFSVIVSGLVVYGWQVGWDRLRSELAVLPRTVWSALSGAGKASWSLVLWAAALALAVSSVLAPAVAGIIGVGLFVAAPSPIAAITGRLFVRLWVAVLGSLAPVYRDRVQGLTAVFLAMVGSALALVLTWPVSSTTARLVLAGVAVVGSYVVLYDAGKGKTAIVFGLAGLGWVAWELAQALPALAQGCCGSEGHHHGLGFNGTSERLATAGGLAAAAGSLVGSALGGVIAAVARPGTAPPGARARREGGGPTRVAADYMGADPPPGEVTSPPGDGPPGDDVSGESSADGPPPAAEQQAARAEPEAPPADDDSSGGEAVELEPEEAPPGGEPEADEVSGPPGEETEPEAPPADDDSSGGEAVEPGPDETPPGGEPPGDEPPADEPGPGEPPPSDEPPDDAPPAAEPPGDESPDARPPDIPPPEPAGGDAVDRLDTGAGGGVGVGEGTDALEPPPPDPIRDPGAAPPPPPGGAGAAVGAAGGADALGGGPPPELSGIGGAPPPEETLPGGAYVGAEEGEEALGGEEAWTPVAVGDWVEAVLTDAGVLDPETVGSLSNVVRGTAGAAHVPTRDLVGSTLGGAHVRSVGAAPGGGVLFNLDVGSGPGGAVVVAVQRGRLTAEIGAGVAAVVGPGIRKALRRVNGALRVQGRRVTDLTVVDDQITVAAG